MANVEDILISIHPRHVDSMVFGRKTVELRRRPLRLSPGCRVWIYCTLPRGSVEAIGIVADVAADDPSVIWTNYGDRCGISKKEFDEYYKGSDTAYVVIFSTVMKLPSTLALIELRKHLSSFHPPQFFKRLVADGPELRLFASVLPAAIAA